MINIEFTTLNFFDGGGEGEYKNCYFEWKAKNNFNSLMADVSFSKAE